MQYSRDLSATRRTGLDLLSHFSPNAGSAYARGRNFDCGPDQPRAVSGLSPFVRRRLVTEPEVITEVLKQHSAVAAEKFIQEVFWRSYWKGWLELRPAVWQSYQTGLRGGLNAVNTQDGLARNWRSACAGDTGIDCFDAWAKELTATGYLHNHARMWFASIWIFTLRLPWELGADFFLRHLLDGDPASNTLGWRWVAGLQTAGKTYLARPDNIEKYTNGRFSPTGLATHAVPLTGPKNPPSGTLPPTDLIDKTLATGLLIHGEDLDLTHVIATGLSLQATATLSSHTTIPPLRTAALVTQFTEDALRDTLHRFTPEGRPLLDPSDVHDVVDVDGLISWAQAHNLKQIVACYAPVGPTADQLAQAQKPLAVQGISLVTIMAPYDRMAWPHATRGFFRFKESIAHFITQIS